MNTYDVIVSKFADDLVLGERFYEAQALNLGVYFFDSLIADIESLSFYGGIHGKYFGFYRMLAKCFPYEISFSSGQQLSFQAAYSAVHWGGCCFSQLFLDFQAAYLAVHKELTYFQLLAYFQAAYSAVHV